MLAFDTKDEKKIDETSAGNNKHDGNVDWREYVGGRKNVSKYGAINKVENTKNCEQYDKCSDGTASNPR